MMGTANILYALGVTELVSMYGSAASEVLGKNDPNAPQIAVVGAREYRTYISFASRLKLIFSEGKVEKQDAVLHPIVSVWANFTPSDRSMYEPHPNERVHFIDDGFTNLCRALLQSQIDFDIVDNRAVLEAEVVGGELRVLGNYYSCVVLPPMDTIQIPTIQRIAQYAQAGGFVIAQGLLPNHAAEGQERDGEVREYVDEIFQKGKNRFTESQIPDFINCLKQHLNPNCEITPPSSEILCTRLSRDGARMFFLVNTSSTGWKAECRFEAAGKITFSYPDSGKVVKLEAVEPEGSSTKLTISLEPYQSVLISLLNSKG